MQPGFIKTGENINIISNTRQRALDAINASLVQFLICVSLGTFSDLYAKSFNTINLTSPDLAASIWITSVTLIVNNQQTHF